LAPPRAWTSQIPTSKLRKAQYSVPDKEKESADAEIVYFYSGSFGGGSLEDNIDRWVGQFKGATRESAKIEKAQGIYPVTFVDLTGTHQAERPDAVEQSGARMIVAAIESSMGVHYLKLVGPGSTVDDWADEFRAISLAARIP